MNATSVFHSTLMQQFATAAKRQTRPPLAMTPWITTTAAPAVSNNEEEQKDEKRKHRNFSSTSLKSASWSLSAAAAARSGQAHPVHSPSLSSVARQIKQEDVLQNRNNATSEENEDQETQQHDDTHQQDRWASAQDFQSLIRTRRTTSHFDVTQTISTDDWKQALDRAVACGRRAPNHKRTEPFRFKRLLTENARDQLAEIAYQVTWQKTQSTINAEQKRRKWAQIPAYLVALVQAPKPLVPDDDTSAQGMYTPLPYIPPRSERELEDYAAACAAVQNVLLSLHAEQIASKWATGPVIQTPAFRQLIGATELDRVVALIMIGLPASKSNSRSKPRRYRRQWDKFVEDL